jgi:hypothetical protein
VSFCYLITFVFVFVCMNMYVDVCVCTCVYMRACVRACVNGRSGDDVDERMECRNVPCRDRRRHRQTSCSWGRACTCDVL